MRQGISANSNAVNRDEKEVANAIVELSERLRRAEMNRKAAERRVNRNRQTKSTR